MSKVLMSFLSLIKMFKIVISIDIRRVYSIEYNLKAIVLVEHL